MLTDTFFENINWLELRFISFEFAYGVTGSFDIIRILENVPQNIQIYLMHEYASKSCNLCFKNVPIKIASLNWEKLLFFEWKEFNCKVEMDQLYENLWFSSVDSESAEGFKERFIHVKKPKQYNFNCRKLSNELLVSKACQTKFPDHNPMSECEFIIPMKYRKSPKQQSVP